MGASAESNKEFAPIELLGAGTAAAGAARGSLLGGGAEGGGGGGTAVPQASLHPRPLSNKFRAALSPPIAVGALVAAGVVAAPPAMPGAIGSLRGDGGTRALSLSPGLVPGGTTMAAVRPVPSSVGKSTLSPGLKPKGTTTQRTLCSDARSSSAHTGEREIGRERKRVNGRIWFKCTNE